MCITESLCCTAEINIGNQLYFNFFKTVDFLMLNHPCITNKSNLIIVYCVL